MRKLRRKKWVATAALGALLAGQLGAPLVYAQSQDPSNNTNTPIKHVMLIIGENRTFDNVFGTYVPPKGQTVWNLLSEGIVNSEGSPGRNFALAEQYQATDTGKFSIDPTADKTPYKTLPPPDVGGPKISWFSGDTVSQVESIEPALPSSTTDYNMLLTGGTGLPFGTVDTRFPSDMRNGPFDITDSISYNDYSGSPVHRFFQMWQQLDCDIGKATVTNPSGCQADLFPWVEVTEAAGSNGAKEPANFVGEGAISMGFYNNSAGDVPYFTQLANEYALSDNDHQAVMGGTGANHIAIGFGTSIYWTKKNGSIGRPPTNQVENPNPFPNTNNFYRQDGYSGGSYVNCSDSNAPRLFTS